MNHERVPVPANVIAAWVAVLVVMVLAGIFFATALTHPTPAPPQPTPNSVTLLPNYPLNDEDGWTTRGPSDYPTP